MGRSLFRRIQLTEIRTREHRGCAPRFAFVRAHDVVFFSRPISSAISGPRQKWNARRLDNSWRQLGRFPSSSFEFFAKRKYLISAGRKISGKTDGERERERCVFFLKLFRFAFSRRGAIITEAWKSVGRQRMEIALRIQRRLWSL